MNPTETQLRKAAARWQGAKNKSLSEDHSAYFIENWYRIPAMMKFVELVISEDKL